MDGVRYPAVNLVSTTPSVERYAGQETPPGWSRTSFKFNEIITNRKKRREIEQWKMAVAADIRNALEYGAQRRHYRRRVTEPLVVRQSDCAQFARGYVWDMRDPDNCMLAATQDMEEGPFNYEYLKSRCGVEYEAATGSKFLDRELLHALRYGIRLKSDFPFCPVLCPPHASSYKHIGTIVQGI